MLPALLALRLPATVDGLGHSF